MSGKLLCKCLRDFRRNRQILLHFFTPDEAGGISEDGLQFLQLLLRHAVHPSQPKCAVGLGKDLAHLYELCQFLEIHMRLFVCNDFS
jgi:hypothetical protein